MMQPRKEENKATVPEKKVGFKIEKKKVEDPFDIEGWAKEMEGLLDGTIEPKKEEEKKEIEIENKEVEQTKKEEEKKEKEAVQKTEKSDDALFGELEKALSEPDAEKKKSTEESKDETDWVVWMQRAVEAEQQLSDLLKVVEEDKAISQERIKGFQEDLEQSNLRSEQFENQTIQILSEVKKERQELERTHEQEMNALKDKMKIMEEKCQRLEESASSSPNAAPDSERVKELEKAVEELKLENARLKHENEDTMNCIEQDTLQWNKMLEDEREKHRLAVEKATELSELYETSRSLVFDLETQLADAKDECEKAKADFAELKSKTVRMAELAAKERRELQEKQKQVESQIGATSNAAAVASPSDEGNAEDRSKVAELQSLLEFEQREKDMLKGELDDLKFKLSQIERRESLKLKQQEETSTPAPPPPPRESTSLESSAKLKRMSVKTEESKKEETEVDKSLESLQSRLEKQRQLRKELAAKAERDRAEKEKDKRLENTISSIRTSQSAAPASSGSVSRDRANGAKCYLLSILFLTVCFRNSCKSQSFGCQIKSRNKQMKIILCTQCSKSNLEGLHHQNFLHSIQLRLLTRKTLCLFLDTLERRYESPLPQSFSFH